MIDRTSVRLKQKRRLIAFLSLLGVGALVIVGRLAELMVIAPSHQLPPPVTLPVVERGPILDRNGKVLAISTRLDTVSAWIPNLEDPQGTAAQLADVLDIDEAELLERFRGSRGFLFIKRKITPTESERIEQLKAAGELKGISLSPEYGRTYPAKELAGHLIGYVGVDNVGLDGIEYSFNEELSPSVVGGSAEVVYGSQVFLTIDVNVQHTVEEAARQAFEEYRADSVMILVMEARTGELLGAGLAPGFDPNEYGRYDRTVLSDRLIAQAYEPWSVFKVVSISSLLEMQAIRPTDTFFCNGYYEKVLPGGQVYRIGDLSAHGLVNAEKILEYSCNVGAAYASDRADPDAFYRMITRFGFGSPTGIPLPGETAGILAPPERWSPRTKPTVTFGQEISVSAVQVLSAATVFANAGQLLKPLIVRKIVSPEGRLIKEFVREPVREVISPETARAVLDMMEKATGERGTARRGAIDGIRISAKTGTAQVPDPSTGTYSESDFLASYLGILPTDNPELIVYVVIEHPRSGQYYGSQIAAPVFRKVAEDLVAYRGILRAGQPVRTHSGEVVVRLPGPITIGAGMPDLRGTPKRLLVPLLKAGSVKMRVLGDGYVVRQDPPPGTVLGKDSVIVLELE